MKGKSRLQNTKQTKTTDAQGLMMNKTFLNGDFSEREQNRMYMKSEQCRLFRNQLKTTCDYLDALDIIDYSLFVGIGKANTPSCSATPGEPFCFEALGSNTRCVHTRSSPSENSGCHPCLHDVGSESTCRNGFHHVPHFSINITECGSECRSDSEISTFLCCWW